MYLQSQRFFYFFLNFTIASFWLEQRAQMKPFLTDALIDDDIKYYFIRTRKLMFSQQSDNIDMSRYLTVFAVSKNNIKQIVYYA